MLLPSKLNVNLPSAISFLDTVLFNSRYFLVFPNRASFAFTVTCYRNWSSYFRITPLLSLCLKRLNCSVEEIAETNEEVFALYYPSEISFLQSEFRSRLKTKPRDRFVSRMIVSQFHGQLELSSKPFLLVYKLGQRGVGRKNVIASYSHFAGPTWMPLFRACPSHGRSDLSMYLTKVSRDIDLRKNKFIHQLT